MTSLLRYKGGKWRSAEWVISHFPAHSCYVEPFAGGASVFFRKPPAPYSVINDLDSEVINFYEVLRARPRDLIRAIRRTPWSRAELKNAYQPSDDILERARRFYVRSWQGWNGQALAGRPSWRFEKSRSTHHNLVRGWQQVRHLAYFVEHLRQAQLESRDALQVIRAFDTPETLFFVDPPYLPETRPNSGRIYSHELDIEDHVALAEALRVCAGYVVLSGYWSPLYARLYNDWMVASQRTTINHGGVRTEYLWISPRTAAALEEAKAA